MAKTRRRIRVTSTFILLVVTVAMSLSPLGSAINNLVTDTLFELRGTLPVPDDVIVVGIDEASFAELDQQWPWPRRLHGQLLDELFAAGAASVAFDIIFAESSNNEDDQAFAAALARHPASVLAADFNIVEDQGWVQQILVRPTDVLVNDNTAVGFVNMPTDPDGALRRIELRNTDMEAISLVSARLVTGGQCCADDLPDTPIGINLIGPPRSVKTVSYYQALNSRKYLPEGLFEGRMVFVGTTTQSSADLKRSSPDHFSTAFTRWGHGFTPGVELHATVAHNLVNQSWLTFVPVSSALGMGVLLAVVSAWFFLRFTPVVSGVILIVEMLLLVIVTGKLFDGQTVFPVTFTLLPLIAVYLESPFFHYYETLREKRFINKTFSTYLNPSVLRALSEHPELLQPGGKTVDATVLFLDVADFTTLSEKYEPEVLIQIMNRFLGALSDIVLKYEGMVDKFIGDAAMCAWGAPLPQEQHAVMACHAALEMRRMIDVVGDREVALTGARLRARIGINSGKMLAGNIGGTQRFDYTVHGNEVNTSSRIEGSNKIYGTQIMLGENTVSRLNDEFALRKVDRVRLKGKHIAINIYELLGLAGQQTETVEKCMKLYGEAWDLYQQRSWQEAIRSFEGILTLLPDDGPSRTLLARCEAYRANPPAQDWDGVFDITTK